MTEHQPAAAVAPPPPNSRIFLGNLASEKTTIAELIQIFSRYGRIIEEPVVRKSFGFIQYDNPDSARAAIEGEAGRILGGMKLGIVLKPAAVGVQKSSSFNFVSRFKFGVQSRKRKG